MRLKLKLRVGDLMRERDITERDMWLKTKVARGSVRSMMRGTNTRVDIKTLEKIADALDVRPMELFEEIEGEPGQKRRMAVGAGRL